MFAHLRPLVLSLAMVLALLPARAPAQDAAPASLIADAVSVQGQNLLVASGHVEVIYDGIVLRASRITYDGSTDRLSIEGPITLLGANGETILASSGELSADLTSGILRSARLVLDEQLQLAASALLRVDGRYTVLERTVASSCKVCDDSETPLWQIRASRIVHDQQERQLYFDHARLELGGLPIAYVPRLRIPDPTLKRARGFLIPSFRATSQLGPGIRLPYFIPLGRHADLTLTPYLSSGQTRTLQFRLRKAFRNGDVALEGAISNDDIVSGARRYLFAEGRFDVPRGFQLSFDIKAVSDDAYLLDYGISSDDRLNSQIALTRTRRDEHIDLALNHYETLRSSDDPKLLPQYRLSGGWTRRFTPPLLGGTATADLSFSAYRRPSDADMIGRDMARISGQFDWRRTWIAQNGLVMTASAGFGLDQYDIADDSSRPSSATRHSQFVSTELRWPMARTGPRGAVYLLEPALQLVWSDTSDADIPNEDSVSLEFDEGNLFAIDRFHGNDAIETGLRANLGVTWTRHAPAGWSLGLTAGRVLRFNGISQFPRDSGLEGNTSDWLAAIQLNHPRGVNLTNRWIFDDEFAFTRNELRLSWSEERWKVASTYLWQAPNPAENRLSDSSEFYIDAAYRFRDNWTASLDWRYDTVADRSIRTGLGLTYENECLLVDLSLSRRFTSSDSVSPTTDVGLVVSLRGFGNSAVSKSRSRSCGVKLARAD